MHLQLAWARNLHQRPNPETILSAPIVLTLERENRLVRLDPTTGSAIWEVQVRNSWGWLDRDERRVFYLNQHDWVQCLDHSDGGALWERSLGDGQGVYGYVVALGDRLLVGGWRGYTRLHCLDAQTGEVVWRYPELEAFAKPIPTPLGVALIRLTPPTGNLILVDISAGHALARLPLPPGVRASDSGSSVQGYGASLIATGHGSIYMLDPTRPSAWERIGDVPNDIVTVSPAILGARLIFQDAVGRISAHDIERGQDIWSLKMEHHYRDFVPATHIRGIGVLIGSSEGRLAIIDEDDQQVVVVTVGKRIATNLGQVGTSRIAFGTSGSLVAYDIR